LFWLVAWHRAEELGREPCQGRLVRHPRRKGAQIVTGRCVSTHGTSRSRHRREPRARPG
jgi:hypothetical protein